MFTERRAVASCLLILNKYDPEYIFYIDCSLSAETVVQVVYVKLEKNKSIRRALVFQRTSPTLIVNTLWNDQSLSSQ
jgi:hypothetical protein